MVDGAGLSDPQVSLCASLGQVGIQSSRCRQGGNHCRSCLTDVGVCYSVLENVLPMKRKRVIGLILTAMALFGAWFCITGYRRGQADFDEVAEGRPPIYAKNIGGFLDGGTAWYLGRGYSVYRMHQYLFGQGNTPPYGYLGGAELHWGFPIRVFVIDDKRYYYIPEKKQEAHENLAANVVLPPNSE